jgi:chemotaxis-related protein WspD
VTALPTVAPATDCWNHIGIRGDRSCPELAEFVHCHNCPVFAAAGRRFLDAPSPTGYLEEWADRLAAPTEDAAADLESVLVFRLADERLALSVHALVEVTPPRTVHRVPFRGGLLAGIVNIRGELHLCAHLAKLLGIEPRAGGSGPTNGASRILVARRDADRWALPVDAVEQVCRVPRDEIAPPPPTVGRATAHLSRGVFAWDGGPVGLLDEGRLFEALRTRLR